MKLTLHNPRSNDPKQWVIWYADILMTCLYWDSRGDKIRSLWAFTSYEHNPCHENSAYGGLNVVLTNQEIAAELVALATEHNAFTGERVRMWFEVIGAL